MLTSIRNFLLLVLLSGSAAAASVDDVVFMTEQYPPFNFKDDDILRGVAVDTLIQMLQKIHSQQKREDIELLPWARAYKRALSEPNTCLFSTTRTEGREKLFKWVGPIASNKVGLIAKRERGIKIQSAEDLRKYKIGTIRDDVAEQFLDNAGFRLSDINRVAETSVNIKKLELGRIDLWAYGEDVAMWELKATGLDPKDYESVYVFDAKELYFAFNRDTPDKVIDTLQSALDALKGDGEYQKIVDRYLR